MQIAVPCEFYMKSAGELANRTMLFKNMSMSIVALTTVPGLAMSDECENSSYGFLLADENVSGRLSGSSRDS
ncbi:hypothetical protein PR003_g10067 [Phytophthora rubi]|uniref:Uncharacterized protein n=1 Tax=Phytophthora rubi TaxID=129364 RepID=A0A6A4FL87_9STRA|nr:hypothetical protein PR002_g11308 [Phytophthora rubi]KAE9030567.1 hypothetical protein PR001_g11222 [Phytophthora rubi]KAE9341288.1 hypothetical protein PR003_g10067 [Phytophthora rubi]